MFKDLSCYSFVTSTVLNFYRMHDQFCFSINGVRYTWCLYEVYSSKGIRHRGHIEFGIVL